MDEAIANARAMSKAKKGADSRTALQWAKTLRDLVELRNTTLTSIKVHLLGRDETGAANEPPDCWDEDSEIMFERWFKRQLSPWTQQDLKLTCEDCGAFSEEVTSRDIDDEKYALCDKCYDKRTAKQADEGESENEAEGM